MEDPIGAYCVIYACTLDTPPSFKRSVPYKVNPALGGVKILQMQPLLVLPMELGPGAPWCTILTVTRYLITQCLGATYITKSYVVNVN